MKKFTRLVAALIIIIILGVLVVIAVTRNGIGSVHNNYGIVINEVMSKNSETCPDENGNYYDWIELYNPTDTRKDISGCGLSDSVKKKIKFVFPRGTYLEAGEFLLIYCSGNTELGDTHTSFSLSSEDMVILYDTGGKVIESVSLRSTEDGHSLGRLSADKADFSEMLPTPGYANTEEGRQAYEEYRALIGSQSASTETDSDIIINEFMASNSTTLESSDGEYYDWVELYNRGESDVNINGLFFSDDTENVKKYQFTTDITISAGGYIVIFCSGNNVSPEGEIHVPFKLSAYEESVVLSDENGKLLDKVTYQRQNADKSMARNDEGTFYECDKPTPGYPNTDAGYQEFAKTSAKPLSALYVSEVMGNNKSTALSIDGRSEYIDYIEIGNASGEDFNLAGYGLTDNPSNPAKWVFPDIKLGPGGKLLLLATGSTDNSKKGGYYQTSFSISSEGETVYLFSPDGKYVDKIVCDAFYANMSYGKASDGSTLLYAKPTPGKDNASTGYTGLTHMPTFSTAPGIYDTDSIEVYIEGEDGENIYYTTDCSTPTNKSTKYTGEPIIVNENTVIRAKSYKKGCYNNFSCVSGTFLLKKDNCDHALPVMALVTDRDNLWNTDTGIYAYGRNANVDDEVWPYEHANFWKDIEVPAYFEVFDDETKKEVFGQNIGINIAGSFGQAREQKGFGVNARDEYGNNRMEYAFLPGREYTEYKSLCLRCGAQDQANGKIRDVLSAGLLRGSDVHFLWQEYKPYVLYLNGKYWGVYFMREKRNRFFVAQHEGLGLANSENITLIKSETRANYGTTEEWKALMNYVRTHDLTNEDNYQYLKDRLDIDSFTDYMICEIYVANSDYWNIQMYKTENGKWKFIYYDFCWSWLTNIEHPTLERRRASAQPCSDLFNALLKRSDFRQKFIKRFAEIMDNVYDEKKVLALIDELYNQVQPEIARERSLFNSKDSPYFNYVDAMNVASYEHFEKEIEKIRTFATKRRAIIIKQLHQQFDSTDKKLIDEVFKDG